MVFLERWIDKLNWKTGIKTGTYSVGQAVLLYLLYIRVVLTL